MCCGHRMNRCISVEARSFCVILIQAFILAAASPGMTERPWDGDPDHREVAFATLSELTVHFVCCKIIGPWLTRGSLSDPS